VRLNNALRLVSERGWAAAIVKPTSESWRWRGGLWPTAVESRWRRSECALARDLGRCSGRRRRADSRRGS